MIYNYAHWNQWLKIQVISHKSDIFIPLDNSADNYGKMDDNATPEEGTQTRPLHLCLLSYTDFTKWEPKTWVMSLWGLCSAQSVPLCLQSYSQLEERTWHHMPHQSSFLFYQSFFRSITSALSLMLNAFLHLHCKTDDGFFKRKNMGF